MKKSVLAVAIAAAAFAASAASAAQVYDKDGTTLAVGGQVEFMAGNAGNTYFGNGSADATTRDRARLTLTGRTQLTSGIAAYAYNEWQAQHAGDSSESVQVAARQQYLGVDFGQFGKVQMGRYKDPFVFASSAVDVLDEVGVFGGNDERNSGHLSYMWKGFGFDAGISYQFAEDNYSTDTVGKFNVDSGFSVYAGYTSPVVAFGPISVRAAYQYLKGQDGNDNASEYKKSYNFKEFIEGYDTEGVLGAEAGYVDNLKTVDVSLSWGTNGKGLYLATNYNYAKASLNNEKGYLTVNSLNGVVLDPAVTVKSAEGFVNSVKTKAWETVVTYGFENGIRLGASYHFIKTTYETAIEDLDADTKFFQLIADYNVTPNFKVWAETCIDAGSDDYVQKITNSTNKIDKDGHNTVMVGARYVF